MRKIVSLIADNIHVLFFLLGLAFGYYAFTLAQLHSYHLFYLQVTREGNPADGDTIGVSIISSVCFYCSAYLFKKNNNVS